MSNQFNHRSNTIQYFLSITLLCFLFSLSATGQQYLTNYGSTNNEWGYSGICIENSSSTTKFVNVGSMLNNVAGSTGNMDIYFSRLDNAGNIVNPSKLIGINQFEEAKYIEKIIDPLTNAHNGYIITGSVHNGDPTKRDLLMVRTDLTGTVLCSAQFGTNDDDEVGYAVKQDEDGNFIATGYKVELATGIESIFTAKLDLGCNLIWSNTYQEMGRIHSYALAMARNITAPTGVTYSEVYALTGKIDQDTYILLLDKNGIVIHQARYDFNWTTNNTEVAYSIQQDFDGGFVIAGESIPPGSTAGTKNIFVHKTDEFLNYIWTNEYNIPNSDVEYAKYIDLVQGSSVNAQGYILTGRAYENLIGTAPSVSGDAFLIHLDDTGNPIFSNIYKDQAYSGSHGNRVDVCYQMGIPSFGVSGFSFKPNATSPVLNFDFDVLAMSTDFMGNLASTSSNCQEQIPLSINPMQSPPFALNADKMLENLMNPPNIFDVDWQEYQVFCENCTNTSNDLGTLTPDCDDFITLSNPIFAGMSPNCSSCTWKYQATGLAVTFPIDVSLLPSNSSIILVCEDVINCCITTMTIDTPCCSDPCDDTWLNVNYTSDPCCAVLDINITDTCLVFKKIITEIITPGVTFATLQVNPIYTGQWVPTMTNIQTAVFTPTVAAPVPGSFPGLIEFCLDNPTAVMPQQIDVHYVVCDSNGLDSIACTETIYFQCLNTAGPCLELKSDSLYCNAAGNYFLDFCIVNNSTDGCVMNQLDLFVGAPLITTPQTFVGLGILPGDCFCATVPITSLIIIPPAAGDPINIGFSSDCCPNELVSYADVLPECCSDPCDDTWLNVNYTSDPCCAVLDINITDTCLVFKKIITEIITPGVTFATLQVNPIYTGQWVPTMTNIQTAVFTPTVAAPVPGSFPGLIEFCLDNPTAVMPQQIDVHYVVCDSNGLDSIACTETIYFQCLNTAGPCLELKSDSLYCNAAGNYFLDFCVVNNSTDGCVMNQLNLFASSPYITTPGTFTGLGILPGDCFCATVPIGSTGTPPMAGDPLNIYFSSDCCPNDVVNYADVFPNCGGVIDDCDIDVLDLSTGLGSAGTALDTNWVVISDPIPSTIEPREADIIAPYPTWSTPFPGTSWISGIPSTTGGPMGDYVFERCFCMDTVRVNPMIQLNILVDDVVDVCLNGVSFGGTSSATIPVGIMTNDPALFQTGKNCIQAKLTNFDNNLMGLNMWGFVSADAGLQRDTCCEVPATITGYKWNDINGDGVWQTFEPALPNWTILLSNGDQTITDPNGMYSFDVSPGTYQVAEQQNPDWIQSYPTSNNGIHTVTVNWGDILTDINFGNWEICPIDVVLPVDAYSPPSTILIQAEESISSNQNNTLGNGTVIYQAGDEINLGAGFEVELGVEFDAYIQDCSTPVLEGEDSQNLQLNDQKETKEAKKVSSPHNN